MKKEDLWKAFCIKNPRFKQEDKNVTLTMNGLKKMFDQTYAHGYDYGFEKGQEAGRDEKSLFKKIFG